MRTSKRYFPQTGMNVLSTASSQTALDDNGEPDMLKSPPSAMSAEAARRETMFGTIPNILTMLRMVSTLPLAGLVLTNRLGLACGVFVGAGALDWLDGQIARRFQGQSSVLGSFLDPVADKVLIAGTTLSLTAVGLVSPWVMAVIVSRDAGLVVAGLLYRGLTKPADAPFFSTTRADSFQVTPSAASKFNMAAQVGLITLALGHGAGFVDMVFGTGVGVAAVGAASAAVVGTTLWSWLGYARSPTFARLVQLIRHSMARNR